MSEAQRRRAWEGRIVKRLILREIETAADPKDRALFVRMLGLRRADRVALFKRVTGWECKDPPVKVKSKSKPRA